MVPAESILNLDSNPRFRTRSVNTASAAGLRQMFPENYNTIIDKDDANIIESKIGSK